MATKAQQLPTRPYFKTKAEWAEWRAGELRSMARSMRFERTRDPAAARVTFAAAGGLLEEAAQMDALAERYRTQGV